MGAESLTVLRWFCSAVGKSENLGGWEAQGLLNGKVLLLVILKHGLQTPEEGIKQRNLNIGADVADKVCFGRT